MTILEIAIATLTFDSQGCGGVGCVIYGMFDSDAAPEYDVEFAAHLPVPNGAFGTLAVATEALCALHEDARPGDHIDLALPVSVARLTTEALADEAAAAMLEEMTGEIANLRRSGLAVRLTGHDRANGDSLARAAVLAEIATDADALAAYRARMNA